MNAIKLPADDNSCGWFETLPKSLKPKPRGAIPRGKINADWLVIGGGFVGMAATRRLAELHPQANIVLLDAQYIGEGTSGRNSGFIIDLPHKGDLVGKDIERKKKFISLNRAAISFLKEQVDRDNIPCDWSHSGKLQGAVSDRGIKFLDHFQLLLKELGEPYEVYESAALRSKVGTDYYRQALFTPGCVLMQPAALMRGISAHLPSNVTVHENTPVYKLQQLQNSWLAGTKDAQFSSPKVILATNIFTEQLGHLKHRMIPIMTFASMTRQLTEAEFAECAADIDWGLTPADYAGTTLRMTNDRRLIVRNQYRFVPNYSSSYEERAQISNMHYSALVARYPMLANVNFDYSWGGVCALSQNYTSYFGELKPGLFSSCCHNGVGAARGTISGKLLAEMASGGDSELQRFMQQVSGKPSRLPPQPALGLGVRTRIKVAQWVSRSEV